jgi:hypothetical protein
MQNNNNNKVPSQGEQLNTLLTFPLKSGKDLRKALSVLAKSPFSDRLILDDQDENLDCYTPGDLKEIGALTPEQTMAYLFQYPENILSSKTNLATWGNGFTTWTNLKKLEKIAIVNFFVMAQAMRGSKNFTNSEEDKGLKKAMLDREAEITEKNTRDEALGELEPNPNPDRFHEEMMAAALAAVFPPLDGAWFSSLSDEQAARVYKGVFKSPSASVDREVLWADIEPEINALRDLLLTPAPPETPKQPPNLPKTGDAYQTPEKGMPQQHVGIHTNFDVTVLDRVVAGGLSVFKEMFPRYERIEEFAKASWETKLRYSNRRNNVKEIFTTYPGKLSEPAVRALLRQELLQCSASVFFAKGTPEVAKRLLQDNPSSLANSVFAFETTSQVVKEQKAEAKLKGGSKRSDKHPEMLRVLRQLSRRLDSSPPNNYTNKKGNRNKKRGFDAEDEKDKFCDKGCGYNYTHDSDGHLSKEELKKKRSFSKK